MRTVVIAIDSSIITTVNNNVTKLFRRLAVRKKGWRKQLINFINIDIFMVYHMFFDRGFRISPVFRRIFLFSFPEGRTSCGILRGEMPRKDSQWYKAIQRIQACPAHNTSSECLCAYQSGIIIIIVINKLIGNSLCDTLLHYFVQTPIAFCRNGQLHLVHLMMWVAL